MKGIAYINNFFIYLVGKYNIIDMIKSNPTKKEHNRKYTDYWSLHFSMNLKIAPLIYKYLYKDATFFLRRKEKILNTVLNTVDKRTVQCNA